MNHEQLLSLLIFAWQYGCLDQTKHTVSGQPVKVLNQGVKTEKSGVFEGVQIESDSVVFTGSIKLLLCASDWRQLEPEEKEGIDVLAVLTDNTVPLHDGTQRRIPVLKVHILAEKTELFQRLISPDNDICPKFVSSLDRIRQLSIFERLYFERLESKCQLIEDTYAELDESWNMAFFRILFDTFAINNKRNREMLNRIATAVRITAITNDLSSLEQTEALLLGVSGLLEEVEQPDDYILRLRAEFLKLKKYFGLRPITLRKNNVFTTQKKDASPWIVIVQLSALLFRRKNLFFSVINAKDDLEIRKLFKTEVSPYWQMHIKPGVQSPRPSRRYLSRKHIDLIMINFVLPFLFAFNKNNRRYEKNELILSIIEQIPCEVNHVTHRWMTRGVELDNAMMSQAVIQQDRFYCEPKRCSICPFGRFILTRKNRN